MFILYEKGSDKEIPLENFQKVTGALFIPKLDFEYLEIIQKVTKKISKLGKKGKLSRQQLWLGSYYRKDVLEGYVPKVSIRWVDDQIGWGVFAEQSFQKCDYIAEYAGLLRKCRRSDRNNEYCFEYLLAPGIKSCYTVDAQMQSGIARFINHSSTRMNLGSALATIDGINHVVLFAREAIAKGAQLTYDYGPDYWSKRENPIDL